MDRVFATIASLAALLAVALGAFGAHALKSRLDPAALQTFEVGVRYHFYHALGLFAVAWAAHSVGGRGVTVAGWLLVAGIAVFSGSLYLLALTGVRWLGAITPIGGMAFLVGWLVLAVSFWRR